MLKYWDKILHDIEYQINKGATIGPGNTSTGSKKKRESESEKPVLCIALLKRYSTLPKGPTENSFSFSQICTHPSGHPSDGRRRDAHRLCWDKDSLVPERRDARDLLPPPTHLLSERVPNIRVRACFDPDRFRFRLCAETRGVRLRLGFDAGALRGGLGCRGDGVRFCVGLRL
jgi:hypothetical protein